MKVTERPLSQPCQHLKKFVGTSADKINFSFLTFMENNMLSVFHIDGAEVGFH